MNSTKAQEKKQVASREKRPTAQTFAHRSEILHARYSAFKVKCVIRRDYTPLPFFVPPSN